MGQWNLRFGYYSERPYARGVPFTNPHVGRIDGESDGAGQLGFVEGLLQDDRRRIERLAVQRFASDEKVRNESSFQNPRHRRDAAAFTQTDVGYDQPRKVPGGCLDCALLGALARQDVMAHLQKNRFEEQRDQRFVFDDEDTQRLHRMPTDGPVIGLSPG